MCPFCFSKFLINQLFISKSYFDLLNNQNGYDQFIGSVSSISWKSLLIILNAYVHFPTLLFSGSVTFSMNPHVRLYVGSSVSVGRFVI